MSLTVSAGRRANNQYALTFLPCVEVRNGKKWSNRASTEGRRTRARDNATRVAARRDVVIAMIYAS